MEKILLCRPRGGLNDMLCQIDRCLNYARNNKRKLWIDSSKSGFLDCMSNYFDKSSEFEFGIPPSGYNDATCIPAFIKGQVFDYRSQYSKDDRNFVEIASRALLTFDFEKEYEESILIHEQCGGGRQSINALAQLSLNAGLKTEILNKIRQFGHYDAVHVRNTDYQTDYVEFFHRIRPQVSGTLVLCTDDYGCQIYAKDFWKDQMMLSNEVPETKGKPLHMNTSLDRYSTNVGTLSDLCILASANKLFFTKTKQGVVSGFSALANMLNSNKDILANLLGTVPK